MKFAVVKLNGRIEVGLITQLEDRELKAQTESCERCETWQQRRANFLPFKCKLKVISCPTREEIHFNGKFK